MGAAVGKVGAAGPPLGWPDQGLNPRHDRAGEGADDLAELPDAAEDADDAEDTQDPQGLDGPGRERGGVRRGGGEALEGLGRGGVVVGRGPGPLCAPRSPDSGRAAAGQRAAGFCRCRHERELSRRPAAGGLSPGPDR